MKLKCPSCSNIIDADKINLVTDLAKCVQCDSIHTVSKLAKSQLSSNDYNSSSPPSGSKITLRKVRRNEYEIFYPAKGFSTSIIPMIFFSLFWLGFIAFWTWGASQGSTFFALFSIPFWIVGIAMILGIVNSMRATQTIKITRQNIIIEKNRPLFSKNYSCYYNEIHSVKMSSNSITPFNAFSNLSFNVKGYGNNKVILSPAILTGAKTIYFFEQANEAERDWIIKFLESLINDIKNGLS